MWIGVYEFQNCLDVPWRVVLNECIELAKEFGGTDGHKYVNAVLNGLAPSLRAAEVAADKASGAAHAQAGNPKGTRAHAGVNPSHDSSATVNANSDVNGDGHGHAPA